SLTQLLNRDALKFAMRRAGWTDDRHVGAGRSVSRRDLYAAAYGHKFENNFQRLAPLAAGR
ncbi:MAG TPA: hypothetical protein VMR03_14055, partial [Parvibaculum sp.]